MVHYHCLLIALSSILTSSWLYSEEPAAEVVTRWYAPEATQGVAVDAEHFYAIANSTIGKYEKDTGERVAVWTASQEYPLTHLNAGIVFDGKLYCSHSNYPHRPETSSIEIFDTQTLEHVGNHSFGFYEGALTWIDRKDGAWWAVFAHYTREDENRPLAKPHTYTSLVKFDKQWRRLEGWVFPEKVLARFAPNSCSGGGWGPGGYLYATGHDLGELYQMQLPKAGSSLQLVKTIKLEVTGQAIAWDRGNPGIIYGISRPKRQVIVSRVPAK